jgi:ethanolamine utilization protein EutN
MQICRIEGSVYATVQDKALDGERLLLAQPLTLEGQPAGAPLVAVDRAQAGPGDLVLVFKEGGSARMVLGNERSPVQAVVIAVIDDVNLVP